MVVFNLYYGRYKMISYILHFIYASISCAPCASPYKQPLLRRPSAFMKIYKNISKYKNTSLGAINKFVSMILLENNQEIIQMMIATWVI